MLTMSEEQKKNWEIAKQLSREVLADDNSPYTGKYIGVVQQKVAVVADSLAQMDDALEALGEVATDASWIQGGVDYDRTYYIWELF